MATAFAIFGAVCTFASPVPLLVARGRPVELGGGIRLSYVLGTIAQFVAGIAWLRSAVLAWRTRWRAMSIAVGAALVSAAISQTLLVVLDL